MDEHDQKPAAGGGAAPEGDTLLRLALKASGIGTWSWDPAVGKARWDEVSRALVGLPKETTLEQLERLLAPGDAGELRSGIEDALESHGQLALEVRAHHGGDGRWIRLRARAVEHAGRTLLLGTAEDETAQHAIHEALRAENQRKDEFLGMLGHELRNPIGALTSGIRLLQKGGRNETELEWIRSMLAEQVTQTSILLEEVLDASRIVRRKIAMRRQPTDLRALLERAVARARILVERRQHELELDLAAADRTVTVDAPRMEQALFHLLSNAARFTPTGGRVRLACRAEGPLLVLEVADTGMGFDAQKALRIFEPVASPHPEGERLGLGIGLLFVREITDLHGGRVELESSGAGQGTSVRMVLPMLDGEADEPHPGLEGPGVELRVLVVEDNRHSAQELTIALEEAGCRVETAFSGAEALRLAGAHLPEVVLLDLSLPDIDGFAVAAELRASDLLRGTRLLALGGFSHPEARQRVLAAGFDGLLLKPVDPLELLAAIAPAAAGRAR